MLKLKLLLEDLEILNRRQALIRKKDHILVGLSGGADSSVLLLLLTKLARKYRLRLAAAHLNHGLSGRPSRRYFETARDLARKLRVPFYSKKVRVQAIAVKNKRCIEESGRIERYRFFESLAGKIGANKIATAHHLDDQAETLLMRLLRGSALRGLGGIPCKRPQGRILVIRPLLNSQKKDILACAKESKLRYCSDPSNRDLSFTRNRVRHVLLPHLAKVYNAKICSTLSNLQKVCSESQDFLEKEARNVYKNLRLKAKKPRAVRLKLRGLKRLHPALCREVLLCAVAELKGDAKSLTRDHFEGMTDLLGSEEHGLETHLPQRITVLKNRSDLEFFKN
jgi:tRNA(Ile)-lysidine synthase